MEIAVVIIIVCALVGIWYYRNGRKDTTPTVYPPSKPTVKRGQKYPTDSD